MQVTAPLRLFALVIIAGGGPADNTAGTTVNTASQPALRKLLNSINSTSSRGSSGVVNSEYCACA